MRLPNRVVYDTRYVLISKSSIAVQVRGNVLLMMAVVIRMLMLGLRRAINNLVGRQLDLDQEMQTAAWEGDIAAIERLFLEGANVRYNDPGGRSALHYAALAGHLRAVQLLVYLGADIGAHNPSALSPVRAAVKKGRVEVARFLLESGAGLCESGYIVAHQGRPVGFTLLHEAAYHGCIEMSDFLLEQGLDINAPCVMRGSRPPCASPIYWAAENHQEAMVVHLSLRGADISVLEKGFPDMYAVAKSAMETGSLKRSCVAVNCIGRTALGL